MTGRAVLSVFSGSMSEIPIKTTVVGSYPVPSWLAAYPTTPHLRDALLVVLKTQELAGLDVISDGELSRFNVNHPETNGMIEYFTNPLAGISSTLSRAELLSFQQEKRTSFRTRPAGVVREAIGPGALDLVSAWNQVAPLATRPLKFTVTSPYMLARTLLDRHYRDVRELAMALAAVLQEQVRELEAAVLQVDEAHLTGHPEDLGWAHEPINRVLAGSPAEKAVHLCFGNYGGQSIQKGLWKSLLPFFNALEADHLVLEFARRGYGELEVFRDLKPGLALGVGVIDIKDNQVETPDQVANRIARAVEILGEARLKWVHPDCGFWMLPRFVADRKMAALVLGRDLFYGKKSS
jgi:5-methyltetrahydropteroyltriglutamate--homocysteine methyltransferase